MKVLVCIPCLLNGGTEVQTLSLVEALVAAGHDVAVACYFEYADGMVERYRAAGAEVKLLLPDGVRPHGLRATVRSLYSGLRAVVKGFGPDVAHVQYMNPGAMPVVMLRLLGVRTILATAHTSGDIYSPNGLRLIRLLTGRVVKAFQCITLVAEKSYFGEAGLFDGRLRPHFTIYNALPSHMSVRTEPRGMCDSGPLTIGVVSRLADIKGMDLVVPAFARVYASDPSVRLLVVGDGAQRALMERQAVECGVDSVVEFAGVKPLQELQEWYDRIDILLMPSRSEGFGLTAVEGMARGCVPVVADVGGLPEVVTAESGLLHRGEDIVDMVAKISMLVADRALLSRLSDGAMRRASDFSMERYRAQIASLYNLI